MADRPVEAIPDVPLSQARTPISRVYRAPAASLMAKGIGFVSDAEPMDAARYNRRVAMRRIVQANWPMIVSFQDVCELAGDVSCVGQAVASVHGDAGFDGQGAQRQAYDVLAFCNELLRYDHPLHLYHHRLYAWALELSIGTTETFVVAANNIGRLRRLWPQAVFLPRELAERLDLPFAQEAELETYLGELADRAESSQVLDHEAAEEPSTPAVPRQLRRPVYRIRHAADMAVLERRGCLAPAWGSGLTRAPPHFDLTRWVPRQPKWWCSEVPVVETPFAVSYVAGALANASTPEATHPTELGLRYHHQFGHA